MESQNKSTLSEDSEIELVNHDGPFHKWLQLKYLPNSVKILEHVRQEVKKTQWYQRLRLDFSEARHLFSIKIFFIWTFALIIFIVYLFNDCSILNQHGLTSNETKYEKCELLTYFAFIDLIGSFIYLLMLGLYVLHLVEIADCLPWFQIEITYSVFYILAVFSLGLAVSVMDLCVACFVLATFQCLTALFFGKFC